MCRAKTIARSCPRAGRLGMTVALLLPFFLALFKLTSAVGVSRGLDGWNGAGHTVCGRFGTVLGGYATFGADMTIDKSWSNLPEHSAVIVNVTVLALDYWTSSDTYTVIVDDMLFGPYGKEAAGVETGHFCGVGDGTLEWQRDTLRVLVLTLPHTTSSLQLKVVSALHGPTSFKSLAIERVTLTTLAGSSSLDISAAAEVRTSSDTATSLSSSGYMIHSGEGGRMLDVSCPTPLIYNVSDDTFNDNTTDGWTGTQVSQCGSYGSVLGGFATFGAGNLTRSFDALPPHNRLQLDMDAFALDDWESGDAYFVFIDDAMFGPYDKFTGTENLGQACGLPEDAARTPTSVGSDTRRRLCITTPHLSSNVTITVVSNVTQHQSSGLCCTWLALDNVVVRTDASFTPTPSPTPSVTPSVTFTSSVTATSTQTATVTSSSTDTSTPSASVTVTPTSSVSLTSTVTPTPSISISSSSSSSASTSWSSSSTTTASVSVTGSASFTSSISFSSTGTLSLSPSSTPSQSLSSTTAPSQSATSTVTVSQSPTITASSSPSSTPSQSLSSTSSPSFSATSTSTTTASPSPTITASPSPSSTPSQSLSSTSSLSLTRTLTATTTATATVTPSSSDSTTTSTTTSPSLTATTTVTTSTSVSPSVTQSADPNFIITGSPAPALQCTSKPHPWNDDSVYKGYGMGLATFISSWIGLLLALHVLYQWCVPRSMVQRITSAVAVIQKDGLPVNTTGFTLIIWSLADAFFRTAPYSWSVVPWAQYGGNLTDRFRDAFFLFLVRPGYWWLLMLGILMVLVTALFYAYFDRSVIRYVNSFRMVSVLPASAIISPKKAADVGVSQSVGAWLVFGVGRWLSGPLFIPAVYLLLDPWLCTMAAGVSTSGGGFAQSYYYVTGECSNVLRCYGFWHWVFLVFSGLGLCLLVWAYAPLKVPAQLKSGFGLPHYEIVTIPLRLLLAWSARVLIFFSPCWSILISTLLNIALLLLLILFLRTSTLRLPLIIRSVLIVTSLWCVGMGMAAIVLYFRRNPPSTGSSCAFAIGICVTLFLFEVGLFVWCWYRSKLLPEVDDDGYMSRQGSVVPFTGGNSQVKSRDPGSIRTVVPMPNNPEDKEEEDVAREANPKPTAEDLVSLNDDMQKALDVIDDIDAHTGERIGRSSSAVRDPRSWATLGMSRRMNLEPEMREGELASNRAEVHAVRLASHSDMRHTGASSQHSPSRQVDNSTPVSIVRNSMPLHGLFPESNYDL